jgi:hypothetical protein
MRSDVESDEFTTVSYEATRPRRRDFLRVLLGRWKPVVRRVERLTAKGMARMLKQTYTADAMREQMYADNPLLSMLEGQSANVPIQRSED